MDMFKSRCKAGPEPSPPSAPTLLRYRSSKSFTMCVVAMAWFTDLFLYAMIVPVIPFALKERVGIPEEYKQYWVSMLLVAYSFTLLVGSPLFGYIADQTDSRRAPFLLGLVSLGASTSLLCFGRTITVLVIGRLMQGLSAAIVATVGLALLMDTIPKDEFGQAIGYVSMANSSGIVAGPALGGILYEKAGYYSVFVVAFSLIAFDTIIRSVLIERPVAEKWLRKLDSEDSERSPLVKHSSASSICSSSSQRSEGSSVNTISSALSPGSFYSALTLLKSPRFVTAIAGSFVIAVLLTAFDSVLPIFAFEKFHFNSAGASLLLVCLCTPFLLSPLSGAFSDKHGARIPVILGFTLAAPALTLLSIVSSVVSICFLLALLGCCITLVSSPIITEMFLVAQEKVLPPSQNDGEHDVDSDHSDAVNAQAAGFNNFAFAGGAIVGPIWGGFVMQTFGWEALLRSLAILCATIVVPVIVFTDRH